MMELNKLFPQILSGYVDNKGCALSANECNELTKYVSGLELELTRLQSVEKAQEWIPVSERLPELSMEYYFVFLTNERTEKAVFMAKNARGPRWMIAGTHRDIEKLVTHWRPLPPPPTGGKNE